MTRLSAPERAAVLALATQQGRAASTRARGAASYREGTEQALFAQRLALDPRTRALAWSATMTGVNLGIKAAAMRKAQGVRRGVPDWMLYEPGGAFREDGGAVAYEFVGLALEFKNPNGKGRVSADQAWWHQRLRANGWRVEVVTTAAAAWAVVVEYLGLAR